MVAWCSLLHDNTHLSLDQKQNQRSSSSNKLKQQEPEQGTAGGRRAAAASRNSWKRLAKQESDDDEYGSLTEASDEEGPDDADCMEFGVDGVDMDEAVMMLDGALLGLPSSGSRRGRKAQGSVHSRSGSVQPSCDSKQGLKDSKSKQLGGYGGAAGRSEFDEDDCSDDMAGSAADDEESEGSDEEVGQGGDRVSCQFAGDHLAGGFCGRV